MTEPDVNIIGTLQVGVLAAAFQTTGFRLHNVTIMLDVSDLEDGGILHGRRVKLNGHFETAEDLESGRRWVFKAHQASSLGR